MTLNHADVIGDQSDAVTQNAWFLCVLCAAISGEISILIQTGAESWGRFPVPRICRLESTVTLAPPVPISQRALRVQQCPEEEQNLISDKTKFT